DAIHSLTHLIVSVITYAGLKVSKTKPSSRFPYGLYKIENMTSLVIALGIFAAGGITGLESFHRLESSGRTTTNEIYGILVSILAILVTLLLGRFLLSIAKESGSPSLRALGEDYRIDAIVSLLVILGLISSLSGLGWVDGAVGLLVSLVILGTAVAIGWDSTKALLDASLGMEQLVQIRQKAEELPNIKVSEINARKAGRAVFVELTAQTSGSFSVKKSQILSDEVERILKGSFDNIERVIVHVAPKEQKQRCIGLVLETNEGQTSRLSSHFGEANYLAIALRSEDGNIKLVSIVENPYRSLDRGRGIKVAEWFISQNVDEVILSELPRGGGPHYVFDSAGISIDTTEKQILRDFGK
ncbi:MAG: cation diffusion facilitator family transporter, partial [Candidatus Thorarchaeota archaeon]